MTSQPPLRKRRRYPRRLPRTHFDMEQIRHEVHGRKSHDGVRPRWLFRPSPSSRLGAQLGAEALGERRDDPLAQLAGVLVRECALRRLEGH